MKIAGVMAAGMVMAWSLLPSLTVFAAPEPAMEEPASEQDMDVLDAGMMGMDSQELETWDVEALESSRDLDGLLVGIETIHEVERTYDAEYQMYRYTFPNGYTFSMNIPNGAVTQNEVRMQLDTDATLAAIYLDGQKLENPENYYFTKAGSYTIRLNCSPKDYETGNYMIYQYQVTFQILSHGKSRSRFLNAPDGYRLEFLQLDNQPVPVGGKSSVCLDKDGTYTARFTSETLPDYRVTFTLDTLPPVVRFSPSIESGILKGPVQFEAAEEDSHVRIYRDGAELTMDQHTLSQGGHYLISVSDQAGNTSSYRFFIRDEYKLFDRPLVILTVIVLGGAVFLVRFRVWGPHE